VGSAVVGPAEDILPAGEQTGRPLSSPEQGLAGSTGQSYGSRWLKSRFSVAEEASSGPHIAHVADRLTSP
jgi:hypothetical protein